MRKLLGLLLLTLALGAAPGLRADASGTLGGYALGGSVLGLLLGSLDLATHKSDEAAQAPGLQDLRLALAPNVKGGGAVYLNASF